MARVYTLTSLIYLSVGCLSTSAVIGDYDLNPNNCGQSRHSLEVSFDCFEWHKEFGTDFVSGLRGGRDVHTMEAPWTVLIFIGELSSGKISTCTGSMVANTWVLTSAHCLYNFTQQNGSIDNVMTIFGHDLRIDKTKGQLPAIRTLNYYIHPAYEVNVKYGSAGLFDIALIELNVTNPLPDSIGSICLPKHNVFNWDNEYAVMAGWGQTNIWRTPLQMSHIKVFGRNEMDWRMDIIEEYYREKSDPILRQHVLERYLFGSPADRDVLGCEGDSGGPLWQYHKGRAVLIGVLKGNALTDTDNCQTFNTRYIDPIIFIRVSHFTEWIADVIHHQIKDNYTGYV